MEKQGQSQQNPWSFLYLFVLLVQKIGGQESLDPWGQVVGKWSESGREVVAKWSGSGREVVGEWSGSGRGMGCQHLSILQALNHFPTTSRPLPDLFPTTSRSLPDLFPTTSRPLPDRFPTISRPLPDRFPTTSRRFEVGYVSLPCHFCED